MISIDEINDISDSMERALSTLHWSDFFKSLSESPLNDSYVSIGLGHWAQEVLEKAYY